MGFSRRLLFRVALGCGVLVSAVGSFLGFRTTAPVHAQSPVPPGPGRRLVSPLDAIEVRAQEAGSGDATLVRTLVDDALNASIFAGSAGSIRERVFRAEMSFRSGKGQAISEPALVGAINSVASIAFAPEAFKTSDEQVHALRIMLNATIPHFIGASDAMSPAEAIFLTGFLTQQKLYNPGLRLDPQEVAAWRASRPAEQTFVDRIGHSAVLTARAMPREMVDVESALREQLPHEWSLVTICVHLFLDRAGLPR